MQGKGVKPCVADTIKICRGKELETGLVGRGGVKIGEWGAASRGNGKGSIREHLPYALMHVSYQRVSENQDYYYYYYFTILLFYYLIPYILLFIDVHVD